MCPTPCSADNSDQPTRRLYVGFLLPTLKADTFRQHMARFGEAFEVFMGGGGWAGLKEGVVSLQRARVRGGWGAEGLWWWAI